MQHMATKANSSKKDPGKYLKTFHQEHNNNKTRNLYFNATKLNMRMKIKAKIVCIHPQLGTCIDDNKERC